MGIGIKHGPKLLLGTLAILCLFGYWVVKKEHEHMRREAEQQLLSIAHSQANLLQRWHFERVADTAVLQSSDDFRKRLQDFLGKGSATARQAVHTRLELQVRSYRYDGASVVNAEGDTLLSVPGDSISPNPYLLSIVREALRSGEIQATPVFSLLPGEPVVAFLFPVFGSDMGEPLGAVVLFNRTRVFLKDLLEDWAVFEGDGHSTLVQLQDQPPTLLADDFQNILSGNGPALKELAELARGASSGKVGRVLDASGQGSVAAAWEVDKTPWALVAILPETMALGQLYRNTTLIVLSLLFALLTLACLFYAIEVRKERNARELVYQAQKKLEEERMRLQAIFDGIQEVIYVSDPNTYELLFVNEAFKREWGAAPPGTKCHSILQGLDSPCSFCNNPKIFGESLGKADIRAFQNLRNRRWYQCSDKAIPWTDGRMVRFEIATDITDRIQMEMELLRFKQAIDATSDAVGMARPDVGHFYQNASYTRMFGYTLEETHGMQPKDFYVNADEMEDMYEALEQGIPWFKEMIVRHKDGHTFPALVRANRILDKEGALVAYFGLITDLTETKQQEHKMQALLKDLEQANQKLIESNRELEQFAYVASHDLQEPLRMVASYTQLLEERYKDRLDEDASRWIGFAVDGARRMQQLIQDLLAYSRVSTRAGEIEPCNLNHTLSVVLMNLEVAIRESGAVVTSDTLPEIQADPSQMVQLLQNLISNALKYRSENAPVIHIAADQNPDSTCLSVTDNGIGIDPRYQEKVFEIFKRLHHHSKYPGTGIGLAVCKRIVDRHGGSIHVVSELGKGCRFNVILPKTISPSES